MIDDPDEILEMGSHAADLLLPQKKNGKNLFTALTGFCFKLLS